MNLAHKQIPLLKPSAKAYGGTLLKTRKGRQGPRPIVTRSTMHMVLRSTVAKQRRYSFWNPVHRAKIETLLVRFSKKHQVHVLSWANVGNHLHLHLQFHSRHSYRPFIRGLTAAIAMAVMGLSRWCNKKSLGIQRFWDHRPFTRIVDNWRQRLNLRDYIHINQLEGLGHHRLEARLIMEEHRGPPGARRI